MFLGLLIGRWERSVEDRVHFPCRWELEFVGGGR